MIIVCPNCGASYRVSAESLGPAGRTVRCAKCSTAWFADADSADDSLSEANGGTLAFTEREEGTPVANPADRIAQVVANLKVDEPTVPDTAKPRLRIGGTPVAKKRLTPLRLAAVAAGLFLAALLLGRASVVRLFPETAALYAAVGLDVNVRGLAFRDVDAVERVEAGVPILLVSGKIENVTGGVIDVPRLRLSVRNMEGRELYVWTVVPRRTRLVAGDILPFQAQLASPPAESRDISVRFLARHDAVTGIH